jgi:N-acetylgalactosamine-6-phosphate deacetylase
MHEPYYISASTIIGEGDNYDNCSLLIEHGKITKIVNKPKENILNFNLPGATILPGLIDLHIHGRDGCDVMDGDINALNTISSSLVKHGVTGFLATTVTSSWDKTIRALNAIGQAARSKMPGAAVLGGYSEGLFFTKDHKGAHDENYFLELTIERVDEMIDAAQGALKVIALAPEKENAVKVTRHITNRNVKVMLGHTNATFQETLDALDAGACGGVHVFNGMRGIHHREPGCTGAVLIKDCSVEVIADGVHLHPAILELISRLKSAGKINLISDCINAGGMPDGEYTLGELQVDVKSGIARTKEGSLAGSTLTLEKAVVNMAKMANIELRDAVHMASLSPALFLNIEDTKGSIKESKDADLCVVGDNGEVLMTIIEGEIVYSKNNASKLKS